MPPSHSLQPVPNEVILLVDDEPIVRRMVSEILRPEGYRVLEARSGPDALQILSQLKSPIHLLLTDIIMPQMDGGELAWAIAQSRPSTRVLFMSGYPNDSSVKKVAVLGGKCICKPFSPKQLRSLVREMLDAPWQGLRAKSGVSGGK